MNREKREEIEALKNIYIKFNKSIDVIAKEFVEELKSGCKTYENMNNKLNGFEKDIIYSNNSQENRVFISYIKNLINREMNDLQITNRSKN